MKTATDSVNAIEIELHRMLAKYAYQYRPDDPFVLASGATSPEYLDCRQALSRPETLPLVGAWMHSQLRDDVVAVGGLTMGADPIAISCAFASHGTAHPVRWFSVRKGAKEHGRKRLIEGSVQRADHVVVVDDVATTGGSTIEAINRCREFGLHVVQALILVDREQGGVQAIKDALGPEATVNACCTKSTIKKHWQHLSNT